MKTRLLSLLARCFGIPEEINGGERCPTYMYRWTLLGTRWGKVYLHRFVGDDWALDLHDHPKRFISIGLWGRYDEERPPPDGSGAIRSVRTYRAPWVRTFPAEHRHRLSLIDGRECWTLVIVGKLVREWGFWNDGRWIQWREYVGGEIADKRKACE